MVSPKISLVVGNGFSISSGIFTGLINEMNSQSPLLWSVKCPSTGGCLLDSLPLLKAIFEENREKNSFEIFELALSLEYCKSIGLDHENVTLESRHFLTFAFSEYSLKQLEYFDENWPWYKWICNPPKN